VAVPTRGETAGYRWFPACFQGLHSWQPFHRRPVVRAIWATGVGDEDLAPWLDALWAENSFANYELVTEDVPIPPLPDFSDLACIHDSAVDYLLDLAKPDVPLLAGLTGWDADEIRAALVEGPAWLIDKRAA
jgi:hypothetical protein